MSIPMMLSMLIQALYNIIDGLFVAGISPEQHELTAVNLAFPAQNLMIAVSVGVGVGINALISRNLGIGNRDKADKIAGQGMFLSILSYILFSIGGSLLARPYFELMTTDITDTLARETVIDMGVSYLRICFIASFGLFCQVVHEKYMQATGKTTLSMITQLVGAIFNIIFDPIFIYVCGMGVAGAALATVCGQILSGVVGILLHHYKNREVRLKLQYVKPDTKIIGEIFKIGLPSILMNSIGSFMTAAFNKIIMPLSEYAVNIFGIYFKLQSFVFMPVFGFNNGMISIVSYNYGARKKKRMLRTIKLGLVYAVSFMLFGFAIFQIFPGMLLSMFNLSEEAIATVGIPALRTISISFIFAGFSIICSAVFQSFGYSLFSMFISIGRQLVTLLPVAFLLSLTGNINNVWWSYPIAEFVCVVLSVFFYLYIYKRKIKTIPDEV
jgi:putative MATE family efflux protein